MKNLILKVLPPILKNKIDNRAELQKVIFNSGWLFLDKIIRMGIGLAVGVWVARYLGPERFGILNYAIAFAALFGAIIGLGFDSIAVRELVKYPKKENLILGTSFILRIIAALLTNVIIIISILLVRPEDSLTQTITIIISISFLFQAFDVIEFYFQARVLSKYSVIAKNIAFLIVAGIKIVLILNNFELIWFAWAILIEAAIGAFFLVIALRKNGIYIIHWKITKADSFDLLKNSWPLILSSLVILVYMRIDQIMIGEMVNDKAVGVYSVAVRLAEIWYFIPVTLTSSLFPAIIRSKQTSEELYLSRLQKLYSLMTWISLIIAVIITFTGEKIILFLFGNEYKEASSVLTIYIWAGVATFLGVASSQYLITENLIRISFYRTLLGMIINVIINFILIPVYGAIGAAIATLISYTIATFAIGLFKSSRGQFYLLLKSFNPFLLRSLIH